MSRMGLARLNARRDANEPAIIKTLQARGFYVARVNGKGIPDLLVSKGGCMWLVEVKQPKGRYKPAQLAFREAWKGPAVITLRSVEDALRFVPDLLQPARAVDAVATPSKPSQAAPSRKKLSDQQVDETGEDV